MSKIKWTLREMLVIQVDKVMKKSVRGFYAVGKSAFKDEEG